MTPPSNPSSLPHHPSSPPPLSLPSSSHYPSSPPLSFSHISPSPPHPSHLSPPSPLNHPTPPSPPSTRVIHSHSPHWNLLQHYPTNRISNTKYTLLTFLPLNLYQQCTQSMNRYFLLIALLQLWSTITPVNPVTTWVPLAVIFSVSALKDAVDDWRRYQGDREANRRKVVRLTRLGHETVASERLQCGDVVRVEEGEEFAADLVLLQSSDGRGGCYIQTANLDGETNLKQRTALDVTQKLSVDDLARLQCTVECALPNKNIYAFDSTITLLSPSSSSLSPSSLSFPSSSFSPPSSSTFPLTTSQLLLQATNLVNTPHVYGLVVYTGNDTKVGQNKNTPRQKYTRLDHAIDRTIVLLFCFQVSLIVVWGVVGSVLLYQDEVARVFYLHLHRADWFDPIVIPLRFLLLASMMIPISLKVTVDFIKVLYSLFIRWDIHMWDDTRQVGAEARNTAIAEELGCVQYLMSDKTGTLTENVMIIREMSTDDRSYGGRVSAGGEEELSVDPELVDSVRRADAKVVSLLRAMIVCNTVVPSRKSEEQREKERKKRAGDVNPYASQEVEYTSSSPDELSLVQFAAAVGFVLEERAGQTLKGRIGKERQQWEVLGVCDFSSVRKRMSVIVQDPTGRMHLLMKGADDVVLTRLSATQHSSTSRWRSILDAYARKGLRTLVFASREMSEAEWTEWKVKWERANLAVSGREEALARVYEEVEHDCEVLGVTGIEDKLQEDVPATLSVLRQAGIKVWMLTGDKQQTAEEIGRSSGLIAQADHVHYLNALSPGELAALISSLLNHLDLDAPAVLDPYALIVDGATLSLCLLHQPGEFYRLSSSAVSVICCRVTPLAEGRCDHPHQRTRQHHPGHRRWGQRRVDDPGGQRRCGHQRAGGSAGRARLRLLHRPLLVPQASAVDPRALVVRAHELDQPVLPVQVDDHLPGAAAVRLPLALQRRLLPRLHLARLLQPRLHLPTGRLLRPGAGPARTHPARLPPSVPHQPRGPLFQPTHARLLAHPLRVPGVRHLAHHLLHRPGPHRPPADRPQPDRHRTHRLLLHRPHPVFHPLHRDVVHHPAQPPHHLGHPRRLLRHQHHSVRQQRVGGQRHLCSAARRPGVLV